MNNTRLTKKILSLLLVLCMTVALIPAAVSANSADAKQAFVELNNLIEDPTKVNTVKEIVSEGWQFVLDSIADSNPITVDDVYVRIQARLTQLGKSGLITPDGSNGTIAESSVKTLIQKMLDNKQEAVTLYNGLKGLGLLSDAKKAFGNAATEGELFVNILSSVKTKQLKLVTMKDGDFVVNDPNNRGLSTLLADAFDAELGSYPLFTVVYAAIEITYNKYITELNQKIDENSVNSQDVIDLLNIYGLYQAPAAAATPTPTPTPSPSTSTDPGTGGGPIIVVPGGVVPAGTPKPTPTPVSTATPNPIIPGGAQEVENISDPDEAIDKAVELLTEAAKLITNAESSILPTKDISKAMAEIAEKAMEKVNTQTIESTVSGTTAKAVISDTAAKELIESMIKITQTADKLSETLEGAGADVKVQAVLNIKVDVKTDVSNVDVELPSALLNASKENKLDKIIIDAGIVKMAVTPEAIKADNNTAVTLSASIVDKDKLPEDVQNIAGDSTVYDYNLIIGGEKVSEFNKPIEIMIPYSLKEGENANRITVFYINDSGKLENVVGKYDAATGTVKFITRHFSYYVVKSNPVSFKDLADVEWAKESIETMASKGIINGVGEDKFNPADNITRAEFAAMMVRAFNLRDLTAVNEFSDVKDTDWFANDVASAVKSGLIQGKGEGIFAPYENITRQDMAVIMARALVSVKAKSASQTLAGYTEKFVDNKEIADYANSAVAITVKYEIVKGKTPEKFVPAGEATRAEAAAMLYRLFNLN